MRMQKVVLQSCLPYNFRQMIYQIFFKYLSKKIPIKTKGVFIFGTKFYWREKFEKIEKIDLLLFC